VDVGGGDVRAEEWQDAIELPTHRDLTRRVGDAVGTHEANRVGDPIHLAELAHYLLMAGRGCSTKRGIEWSMNE
jgi:hypothetical protein